MSQKNSGQVGWLVSTPTKFRFIKNCCHLIAIKGIGCFQQDGATAHTARNTLRYLRQFLDDRLISRDSPFIREALPLRHWFVFLRT
jgi:hypothetical protein